MHPERRLETGEHGRPFIGRNKSRDIPVTGDVIAKQDGDVGAERVGVFDDRLDTFQRHPGIAGVNIGDDGDLEFQIGRPLRRRNLIARDPKLQLGFAEAIGDRRNAGNAEA